MTSRFDERIIITPTETQRAQKEIFLIHQNPSFKNFFVVSLQTISV